MPLVEVRHLVKHFTRDAGFFRAGTRVSAVDNVSFEVKAGGIRFFHPQRLLKPIVLEADVHPGFMTD